MSSLTTVPNDPPSLILGEWLAANAGRTLGVDTFIGMLPASEQDGPVEAMMLGDTTGIRRGRGGIPGELVDIQALGVNIINRDASYGNNWSELQSLRKQFNEITNEPMTVNGNPYTIGSVLVASGPNFIGHDDTTNACLLSLNLLVTIWST